ncbi:hypothetical protein PENSPDRAFT_752177 [Peniophora sp. CONT]|nr:hypothetical protein PENSPDRAFT_752177 [Peniophora sp. CONT]
MSNAEDNEREMTEGQGEGEAFVGNEARGVWLARGPLSFAAGERYATMDWSAIAQTAGHTYDVCSNFAAMILENRKKAEGAASVEGRDDAAPPDRGDGGSHHTSAPIAEVECKECEAIDTEKDKDEKKNADITYEAMAASACMDKLFRAKNALRRDEYLSSVDEMRRRVREKSGSIMDMKRKDTRDIYAEWCINCPSTGLNVGDGDEAIHENTAAEDGEEESPWGLE